MEFELDSRQCAEVALYMYKQWQEAMKAPLYVYQDFPHWLEQIVKLEAAPERTALEAADSILQCHVDATRGGDAA